LIIFGLVIDLGGGPDHDRIGFRYWDNPGPFAEYIVTGATGRFVGVWAVLTSAAYAYSGAETVAMAASECRNPRTAIPKAAKRIFIRVFFFYIICVFIVGLIVPSNDPALLNSSGTASESPFVVAANRAGVKVLPHIINAVIVTSAWSAANSGMLGGSRALYGLALDGLAPKFFTRVSRFGVPYIAICVILAFSPLSYMTLGPSATVAFGWMQDLVSSITLIVWISICAIYIRFYNGLKVQGISRNELPYKSPLQPYLAWFSMLFCGLVLLTGGFTVFIHGNWEFEDFFSSYFSIVLYAVFYFGFKLVRRTKMVALEDMRLQEFVDFHKMNPEPVIPAPKGPWGWFTSFMWG